MNEVILKLLIHDLQIFLSWWKSFVFKCIKKEHIIQSFFYCPCTNCLYSHNGRKNTSSYIQFAVHKWPQRISSCKI